MVAFERCADVSGYRNRLVTIDYVSIPAPSTLTVYLQPAASWPGWSDAAGLADFPGHALQLFERTKPRLVQCGDVP